MTSYDLANERISEDIANSKIDTTTDNTNANNYAKNLMTSYEQDSMNPSRQQQNQQQQQQQQQTPHERHESQEYRPPVPPSQDSPGPQQSQHMNYSPQSSVQSSVQSSGGNGNYTGFDSTDNLSPLDTAFNVIKEPAQQQRQRGNVNGGSRTNDIVEPYDGVEADSFSSF
jgi:hypothetical protein